LKLFDTKVQDNNCAYVAAQLLFLDCLLGITALKLTIYPGGEALLKIKRRPLLILLGCGLINFAIGTFYTWSVFLEPLQAALNVNRSQVSVVFSVATITFTLAMLFGSPVYRRVRPSVIATGSLLLGSTGLAIAAFGMSLPLIILGYGVFFGVAAAFGYNLSLQLVNSELPTHSGLATGFVVGSFAAGSVIFAPIFVYTVRQSGVQTTFFGLALFLLLAAIVSGSLITRAGVSTAVKHFSEDHGKPAKQHRVFFSLWFGFAFSALAGLMVISHAAGIMSAFGGTAAQIALGAMLVSIGNLTGRFSAGWLGQHFPVRRIFPIVTVSASLGCLLLAFLPSVWMAIAMLSLVGLVYGANASLYPISVTLYYGREHLAKVFGVLMTAWGIAGLTAPWLAGLIFDATGQYTYAILAAAAATLISSMATFLLPEQSQERSNRLPGHAKAN
jgi:MFS family permease